MKGYVMVFNSYCDNLPLSFLLGCISLIENCSQQLFWHRVLKFTACNIIKEADVLLKQALL